MVTPGINPEESAQPATKQDVIDIVTEVVKGLMPVAAPSTPSAPMTMQPSGRPILGAKVSGASTTRSRRPDWTNLDDSIPMVSCDAGLCPLPPGIVESQVYYTQPDGTQTPVAREYQDACIEDSAGIRKWYTIAGVNENNAGEYFAPADSACFRCQSTQPAYVTTGNPRGMYSKGYLTLRNLHNNHYQDGINHLGTRKNGQVMDFSINGRAPTSYTVEEYIAVKTQLHPLNGAVTTDVTDLTLAAIPKVKVVQEEMSEDEPPF